MADYIRVHLTAAQQAAMGEPTDAIDAEFLEFEGAQIAILDPSFGVRVEAPAEATDGGSRSGA
jgi:hypothetical protein